MCKIFNSMDLTYTFAKKQKQKQKPCSSEPPTLQKIECPTPIMRYYMVKKNSRLLQENWITEGSLNAMKDAET